MTLPTCLEPANARFTIPVVFAVCYALYHVWRWRMMHPKIVLEDLPEPASEVLAVAPAPVRDAQAENAAEVSETRKRVFAEAARRESEKKRRPHGADSHRSSRWKSRFDREAEQVQFDTEALDGFYHNRALHKATHGRPEYYVRLAEYAWRRGAMVETHYWLSMAKFKGVAGLDEWIERVRRLWIQRGRWAEADNVYEAFPFERNVLAYQYLMLVCGFSVQVNHLFLVREAQNGSEEAQLILENTPLAR